MTNQEIDEWVLTRIQTEQREFPEDRITNLGLGLALLYFLGDKLPPSKKGGAHPQNALQNAQELANQSCQRLRKKGLLTYSSKEK
jgi:hypothetical protein